MSIANKLQTIADNQQEVYNAGKKSEYDAFWDGLQHNGDGTADCRYMFFYWDNEIYNPKYPIYSTKENMMNTFTNARIENTLVDVDLSGATNCNHFFSYCSFLHTIPKLIMAEQNTLTGFFGGCLALANLTIEGIIGDSLDMKSCPLTRASIESVFNALSATKTGLTATFKKTAVNAAFTDAEWSALVATKPNWTITLV